MSRNVNKQALWAIEIYFQIERVVTSFQSPAWVNNPVEYEVVDLGWSTTNEENYQEGGAHLKSKMMLKNPG